MAATIGLERGPVVLGREAPADRARTPTATTSSSHAGCCPVAVARSQVCTVELVGVAGQASRHPTTVAHGSTTVRSRERSSVHAACTRVGPAAEQVEPAVVGDGRDVERPFGHRVAALADQRARGPSRRTTWPSRPRTVKSWHGVGQVELVGGDGADHPAGEADGLGEHRRGSSPGPAPSARHRVEWQRWWWWQWCVVGHVRTSHR